MSNNRVKNLVIIMESAGYWVAIYSSESFFNSEMQSMEDARKEMGLSDKDDRPLKQNMFKVV